VTRHPFQVESLKITVSISTRNRAESLRAALGALSRTTPPSGDWDIVVANNGSTDHTSQVIREASRGLPVREAFEPLPGLSNARNRSIEASTGDVIAFTDDDCLPDPGWLTAIETAFRSEPDLMGLGGRVDLFDSRDRPVTIRTSRERIPLTSPGQLFSIIAGCNMAFRRDTFDTIGTFDPQLGAGASGASAEDVDFLFRCLKAKLRVEYLPYVLVSHNHGRRTDAQVAALHRNYRIGRGAFYAKWILEGEREIFRQMVWEVQGLLSEAAGGLLKRRPGSILSISHLGHLSIGAWERARGRTP